MLAMVMPSESLITISLLFFLLTCSFTPPPSIFTACSPCSLLRSWQQPVCSNRDVFSVKVCQWGCLHMDTVNKDGAAKDSTSRLICLTVRLWSVPLSVFTFSHSWGPPLCSPLFVSALPTDCLFMTGPAAASAPQDEIVMGIIVMVIVIFCE